MDANRKERSQKVKYHQWRHRRRNLKFLSGNSGAFDAQGVCASILWKASSHAFPDATMRTGPGRSIAYLVSRYPTLSMIFVLREVLALRALGFRIETASINPPDRPLEKLTPQER
jgi:hypothetical protein